MYYDDFMDITLSITSRNQVYFPEILVNALKLISPGKFTLSILSDSRVQIKPVRDVMEFAGKGKDMAHLNIWKNYRDKMETEYEDVR